METINEQKTLIEKSYKKHIAVYIRSKDSEGAEWQVKCYKEKFNHAENIEVVGFYADIGASANSKEKSALSQLIAECRKGKIDEIYVKSVSRLTRHSLDAVAIIKELKDLGVGIYFEAINLNSLSPQGELLLSVLASMAAQEVKSEGDAQEGIMLCEEESKLEEDTK